MNRLLIVALFGVSALLSMEDAPVGRVLPRKLRLTKLYKQLRPEYVGAGYYDVLDLARLPRLISENRAYLEQLESEDSYAEEMAALEVSILYGELIIEQLQKNFDQTRSKRELYRFSK